MRERVDIILQGAFIITVDRQGKIIRDGAVAINGSNIEDVDKSNRILERFRAEETINAGKSVIMPGLINAHTHETLIRGFWDILSGKTLYEQMLMAYFMELCVEEKHALAAAKLNQLEMIKNGTTTFIDMWRHPRTAAQTLEYSGLRGVLAPQIADTTPWQPIHQGKYWMESVENTESLIKEFHGRADGRISIWFGPHSPYSCSEETLRRIRELASKYRVGIHIHVSEGLSEINDFKKKKRLRPVEWLEKIGLLDRDVHAAHCVWLSKKEITIFKLRGVTVAHMPKGNMKSGMGVAPVLDLMKNGVTVGLGTDSNMGPNNLDMFEEMRAACCLHRLSKMDSTILPASTVIKMATIEGAKCLRMDKIIGSLEKGKKADIISVSIDRPHNTPLLANSASNLQENIVFSTWGSDVNISIVDGKILMKDRQVYTMDEQLIVDEATVAAEDLLYKTFEMFKEARVKLKL